MSILNEMIEKDGNNTEIERSRWVIDKNIPIFKGESREYIETLINVEA